MMSSKCESLIFCCLTQPVVIYPSTLNILPQYQIASFQVTSLECIFLKYCDVYVYPSGKLAF